MITTYNAKEWSVIVKGDTYITGFDEDMFSYSKDEAFGEYSVGACGDAMFSETNNDLHTFSITLQHTSPSVPLLIDLMNNREVFSIYAINKKLGRKMGGEYARVTEAPEQAGSATGEPLEFTIQVADGKTENI